MGESADTTVDDALAKAEEIQERSIQDQALHYVPNAMKTLGKFAQGHQVNKVIPNAQVVRSAARDVIEFAGGRPETRDPRIGGGEGSTLIIIQKFGDGTQRRIDPHAPIEMEIADPLEAAENAARSVSKTFEVPDAKVHFDPDSPRGRARLRRREK